MYKTIRHGENSLQYTILPQHDDYSKGGGGGGSSGGAGGQSSLAPEALGIGVGGVTIVRKKKRSWMAYVGLFFVCSIISGAILVPLLVSVEVLSGPKEWFYRHTGQRLGVYKPSSNIAKVLASGGVASAYRHEPKPVEVNRTDPTKTPSVLVPILGDEFSDEEENTNEETTPNSAIVTPNLDSVAVVSSLSPNLVHKETSELLASKESLLQTIGDIPTPKPLMPVATSPEPEPTIQYTKYDFIPITGRKLKKPKISRPNLAPVVVPTISINPTKAPVPVVASASPTIPKRNWIDSHQWNSYNATVPVYNSSVQPLAIVCSAIAGMFLTMGCFLLLKKCTGNKQKRTDLLTVEAQNGDNTTLLTHEEEEDEITEDE